MRPRIEIDIEKVEQLAGQGLSQSEICLCIGISENTLYRRKNDMEVLAEAIKRGKASAYATISNKLFSMASDGDLGAIVWYEKTRRGMSERVISRTETEIDWSQVDTETIDAYCDGRLTEDDVRRSLIRQSQSRPR